MNPILIIALIVVWLASLAGVGGWQYGAGITAQKVADQQQFDGINQQIAGQKTEAAAILKTRNAETLALMIERDQLKSTLEQTHEDNRKVTTAARDHYAGLGLRFQPAQAAGCGGGGRNTPDAAADAAGTAGATPVELPAAVAASLRQIAYDADTLADSYRECYGYAERVR